MAPQSDEANLARIRDNQRRSRARRKEYQQELEQRVRAFEEMGVEASTEVQQAARRVAEENKKLRLLLHNTGVGHAQIETFLRTGEYTATGPSSASSRAGTPKTVSASASVQALDHLMVPRHPLHYTSPFPGGGALSASGSVGPSSPAATSVAGTGPATGPATNTNTNTNTASSEPAFAPDTSIMGAHAAEHSATSSPRVSSSRSLEPQHIRSSSEQGHNPDPNTNTNTDTNTNPSYLTDYGMPGPGNATAFYGMDTASTEDLSYADGSFFDYGVPQHYLGGTSAIDPGHAHASTPYYGQVPAMMHGSSSCASCLSGLGCPIHFFEE